MESKPEIAMTFKPSRRSKASTSQTGFTLMELMIAVAIVGILATVALPSYQNTMVKSRRSSAQTFLLSVAQQQHQYFVDNRAYTTCLSTSGSCTSSLNTMIPSSVSGNYTVVVTLAITSPPGFTVTAIPIAGGPQGSDVSLSIDNTGVKLPSSVW